MYLAVRLIMEEKLMQSQTQSAPVSKKMLWAGRIMSALPVLTLLMSASMKFLKPALVMEGFAHLGLRHIRSDDRLSVQLAHCMHLLGTYHTQTALECFR